MRSKLQYIYSISVFVGVLITSYMMMNQDDSARVPFQSVQNPGTRVEASVGDPALQSLIDVENALKALKKDKAPAQKRVPTFNRTAE